MEYVIRKKELKDCAGVQKVITKAWRQTYKGIVNDKFLDGLLDNEEDRINRSIKRFDEANNTQYVLEVDGKIVGFVNYGQSSYENCGEVRALYIIDGYKGYGFGKKLFNKAVEELEKLGYKEIIIGCLNGNKANEFYKHLGGKFIETRIYSNTGENLDENMYKIKL